MKKCIYKGGDEYYQIKYFNVGDIYRYETYMNKDDERYRIFHSEKGSYSTLPDHIFHMLFHDIREYNLSKLNL